MNKLIMMVVGSTLVLSTQLFLSSSAEAVSRKKVNLNQDFESLGDNKEVVERAQSLSVDKKVLVVQNRTVDRNLRFELGASYGLVGGGDSYIRTQNLGALAEFHINPHWSVGGRLFHAYNSLTDEGRYMYDSAQSIVNSQGPNARYLVPQVDAPVDTYLGVINWYPFYGKLNLLDMGVAHFDFYLQAGYGKTVLLSGSSSTFAGGAGVGFWWSQHFTSRLEVTYLNYKDLIGIMDRQQSAFQGFLSLGVML